MEDHECVLDWWSDQRIRSSRKILLDLCTSSVLPFAGLVIAFKLSLEVLSFSTNFHDHCCVVIASCSLLVENPVVSNAECFYLCGNEPEAFLDI